ncbi:MAG: hypothetical protein MUC83_18385 [Pirellula sp.]|nr:hypothetical protein [Pirellula sp.]
MKAIKLSSCDELRSTEKWQVHTGLLETLCDEKNLWPLAQSHGMAFFQVTDVDDPPPIDENEVAIFGLSYREYWDMFPEKREEHSSEPKQTLHCCLLLMGSPYVQWQIANSTIDMRTGTYYLASSETCYPALLLINAKELESKWIASSRLSVDLNQVDAICNGEGVRIGWRLGPDANVLDQSLPPNVLRKWDWKWSRTCGPVYLWIDVNRTQVELIQWYQGLTLIQYIEHMDCLYPNGMQQAQVADRYVKIEDGVYGLLDSQQLSRELYLRDGRVELLHGVGFKSEQLSCDATMLASLLKGDLGEVSRWQLIDADWGNCEASGQGLDSLRIYLDPSVDKRTFDQKPFKLNQERAGHATGQPHDGMRG